MEDNNCDVIDLLSSPSDAISSSSDDNVHSGQDRITFSSVEDDLTTKQIAEMGSSTRREVEGAQRAIPENRGSQKSCCSEILKPHVSPAYTKTDIMEDNNCDVIDLLSSPSDAISSSSDDNVHSGQDRITFSSVEDDLTTKQIAEMGSSTRREVEGAQRAIPENRGSQKSCCSEILKPHVSPAYTKTDIMEDNNCDVIDLLSSPSDAISSSSDDNVHSGQDRITFSSVEDDLTTKQIAEMGSSTRREVEGAQRAIPENRGSQKSCCSEILKPHVSPAYTKTDIMEDNNCDVIDLLSSPSDAISSSSDDNVHSGQDRITFSSVEDDLTTKQIAEMGSSTRREVEGAQRAIPENRGGRKFCSCRNPNLQESVHLPTCPLDNNSHSMEGEIINISSSSDDNMVEDDQTEEEYKDDEADASCEHSAHHRSAEEEFDHNEMQGEDPKHSDADEEEPKEESEPEDDCSDGAADDNKEMEGQEDESEDDPKDESDETDKSDGRKEDDGESEDPDSSGSDSEAVVVLDIRKRREMMDVTTGALLNMTSAVDLLFHPSSLEVIGAYSNYTGCYALENGVLTQVGPLSRLKSISALAYNLEGDTLFGIRNRSLLKIEKVASRCSATTVHEFTENISAITCSIDEILCGSDKGTLFVVLQSTFTLAFSLKVADEMIDSLVVHNNIAYCVLMNEVFAVDILKAEIVQKHGYTCDLTNAVIRANSLVVGSSRGELVFYNKISLDFQGTYWANRRTGITCLSTVGETQVAVAFDNGNIQLHTLFPNAVVGIIGVVETFVTRMTVSFDEMWLLANDADRHCKLFSLADIEDASPEKKKRKLKNSTKHLSSSRVEEKGEFFCSLKK